MAGKTRSWWGWGNVEDAVVGEELRQLTRTRLVDAARTPTSRRTQAPPVESFEVPASRVRPPEALAALTSEDPMDRLAHSHGRAFRDVVRALLGRLDFVPDLVVRPTSEAEVAQVLDWCSDARIAVIPFGGGSSVVGGVEPRVGDGYAAAVSLDLGSMNRVLGDRHDQPGGPGAGGRARSAPGGAAQAQRLHPAVLPAVLRVLDARRLAGDQSRRPLRHRPHPHRRPHGVAARRHPCRSRRVPPAPGVRGRTVT